MKRSLLASACLVATWVSCCGVALAAPRTPSDDAEVLEVLAVKRGDPLELRREALRLALAREPQNADVAAQLARLHIARSRSESDPRQLGQAQAALARWWGDPEPPPQVLLLRATIRQSNHEFDAALADLIRATQREPRDAQAWLTLATVQQVTGDPDSARQSCRRLAGLSSVLVTMTCIAGVEGATGHAAEALRSLNAVTQVSSGDATAVRGWAATLQAELAERLSMPREAEAHFSRALALDPADAYAIAAYSDFLLDEGRPREVLALISRDTPSDPLFLRYVIAARRAGAADMEAATAKLRARFEATRARGDRVHLREEARYTLEILHDANGALALARDNWKVQKEPADARILLESARGANDPAAAREIATWVARTRLEGPRLASLAAGA